MVIIFVGLLLVPAGATMPRALPGCNVLRGLSGDNFNARLCALKHLHFFVPWGG